MTKFTKLASVAALTLGVAFAAQPAQKASAQVRKESIAGAGASSVTTLFLDDQSTGGPGVVWQYANANGTPFTYVVTGSGAGRTALLNGTVDFAAADGIGTSFGASTVVRNNTIVNSVNNQVVLDPLAGNLPYVVVNEANLNVAFPFNVPGFDVRINGVTACRILRGNAALGDPVNWSQVRNVTATGAPGVLGPNLPIRRVARGDVSGTTSVLQGPTTPTFPTNYGFVQACNGQVPGLGSADSSFTGTGTIPSIVPATSNGFNDGTTIPNRRTGANGDIIVNAASASGNAPADPFGAATSLKDDSNSSTPQLGSNPAFTGSYTLGIINAVRNTPGAIGYVETAAANANGFFAVGTPGYTTGRGLAVDVDPTLPAPFNTGISTVAVGPTYTIFRENYPNQNTVVAAQNACEGAVFSAFEGNGGNYPNEAKFNINTSGFASPYLIPGTTEAGTDTDNYGSYVSVIIGNNYFDVGPCARIGAPGLNLLTFTGTRSGTSITVSTQPTIFPGQTTPRTRLQYGDTVEVTDASGNITYGTVVSPTSGQVAPGGTVQLSVWQASNRNEINVLNGNRNLTLTVNYQ